jgi:hypothetical protein
VPLLRPLSCRLNQSTLLLMFKYLSWLKLVINATRPLEDPPHSSKSSVKLPMSSYVSLLRPVERAINPSLVNGLLPEYQQIILMCSSVRLTRFWAIAFAPIVPILLRKTYNFFKFLSCITSIVASLSPIWQSTELLEFVTEAQYLQQWQTANSICSSHSHGY